jgi:hypothetical protein
MRKIRKEVRVPKQYSSIHYHTTKCLARITHACARPHTTQTTQTGVPQQHRYVQFLSSLMEQKDRSVLIFYLVLFLFCISLHTIIHTLRLKIGVQAQIYCCKFNRNDITSIRLSPNQWHSSQRV